MPTSHLANRLAFGLARPRARCGEIKTFVAARPDFCQQPVGARVSGAQIFTAACPKTIVISMEYYLAMLL